MTASTVANTSFGASPMLRKRASSECAETLSGIERGCQEEPPWPHFVEATPSKLSKSKTASCGGYETRVPVRTARMVFMTDRLRTAPMRGVMVLGSGDEQEGTRSESWDSNRGKSIIGCGFGQGRRPIDAGACVA